MGMTFADAAERVLRDAGGALPVAELWQRIAAKSLVETAGATPEATLRVSLLRQTAGSSLAAGKGAPRFYRRGDGAYGLWADLTSEQQRAMTQAPPAIERVRPRDFAADRDGMRQDPTIAARVLGWLIPAEGPRRAAAELLAHLIEDAHAAGERRWKLTLGSRSFRLTVGRVLVVRLEHDLWMSAQPELLDAELRALFDGVVTRDLETTPFRAHPEFSFYSVAPDLLAEASTAVRAALLPVIRTAAAVSDGDVHGARYHSPGALAALSELIGRSLPLPSYHGGEEEPGEDEGTGEDEAPGEDASLEELLEEFLGDYVPTAEAQALFATYGPERHAAVANLERIAQLEQAGADVTDAVLRGLLPHTDSQNHRSQGCWISHAPAIQGDIKLWFENAGWVKRETWPQVARAILDFVRSALARPAQLSVAITLFQGSTFSKGLGAGMLTPILNALAPEHFPLLNGKVADVVNHFAEVSITPTLEDYPDAIPVIQLLVDNTPLLRDPRVAGIAPGDVFDHFCHWLVAVRGLALGGEGAVGRYWKISPGAGAELWDDWRARSVASIGWEHLGDLSSVRTEAELRARVEQAASEHPEYKLAGARQAWNLARMRPGTLLLANRGRSEVLGIGRVTGPYRYVPEGSMRHEIPVDWYDVNVRAVNRPGWARTLIELDKPTFDELVSLPPVGKGQSGGGGVTAPPYTMERFVAETGMARPEAERWLRILQAKRQIIIQGPPGTGKTYVAERLAKLLVAGASDHIRLVQFHPAYGYEDFIQGIRPRVVDHALSYDLMPGRFLEFCVEARPPAPSVLIIDEINRANLPRVFGELMYLLEYRDRTVPLAAGGELQIPGNVYLIGTMNTADRSIARLDHALRRRFSFLRLQPNYEVLRAHGQRRAFEGIDPLIQTLDRINRKIADPNFALGISYFLHEDLDERLPDVWTCEIEPYLEEYFYDQPATVDEFRWSGLVAGPLAAWRPAE